MKWIDVEDELPELNKHSQTNPDLVMSQRVLICDKSEVPSVGYFSYDKEENEYNWFIAQCWDDIFIASVTHWMPLPEPPRSKNEVD